MASVPTEVLLSFHSMERDIFTRLVLDMGRDPFRSMQMIALWLWLERIGFPNIIQKMLTLPERVVNIIAEEAEACLRCLQIDMPSPPPSQDNIPITRSLIEQPFSLYFFHDKRQEALSGIKTIMDDVCSRIFNDIVQRILDTVRSQAIPPSNITQNVDQMITPGSWITPHQEGTSRQGATFGAAEMMMMMMGPGFQPFYRPGQSAPVGNPPVGGGEGPSNVPQILTDPYPLEGEPQDWGSDIINLLMIGTGLNPLAKPWAPEDEVFHEDRTMFLTFSRGYPLSEEEIKEFFTMHWGECIQSLHVQETEAGTQPLFARLVLHSPAMIPLILQGKEKAKFVIKGKHVWVRPYIPKKSKAQ